MKTNNQRRRRRRSGSEERRPKKLCRVCMSGGEAGIGQEAKTGGETKTGGEGVCSNVSTLEEVLAQIGVLTDLA